MKWISQTAGPALAILAATLNVTSCANLPADFGDIHDPPSRNAEGPRSNPSDSEWLNQDNAEQQSSIVLGMPMNQVQASWGEPVKVEIAGNPGDGDEKWIYFDGLSSRWGLGNKHEVYFENGRVSGWNTPSK